MLMDLLTVEKRKIKKKRPVMAHFKTIDSLVEWLWEEIHFRRTTK